MPKSYELLSAAFFAQDVQHVAEQLIGRQLLVDQVSALILETEAYGDASDLASHAAFRPGGKAAVMAGTPAIAYVYAAYGVYPCFNIVAAPEGRAAAVLVRAVSIDGVVISGPGRVCRALGITLADQGAAVLGGRFGVSVERIALDIQRTPRIGIKRGTETHWRFIATDS